MHQADKLRSAITNRIAFTQNCSWDEILYHSITPFFYLFILKSCLHCFFPLKQSYCIFMLTFSLMQFALIYVAESPSMSHWQRFVFRFSLHTAKQMLWSEWESASLVNRFAKRSSQMSVRYGVWKMCLFSSSMLPVILLLTLASVFTGGELETMILAVEWIAVLKSLSQELRGCLLFADGTVATIISFLLEMMENSDNL